MKLKSKFNVEKFEEKRFEIKLSKPEVNDSAILTHYLHNFHNGVSKHYEKDALKVLKNYVTEYQNEENLSIVEEQALQQLLFEVENVPFPTPKNYSFKFIDLFAGIGGFRIAMQNLGGKCVFTSEWNKEAQRTYKTNFGEVPFGDITKETNDTVIYFNPLC